MPPIIKPTSKQKRNFIIHFVVFAIATAILWTTYDNGIDGWAYPWPAWITAAWGLALIGHGCIVFLSTEDKGLDTYKHQDQHG